MRYRKWLFLGIVFLALTLMGLIVITQLFTNKSTVALRTGNVQAVETFKVNNRIQELVNLSFDLQTKLSKPLQNVTLEKKKSLTDSLTILGYNTNVLINSVNKIEPISNVNELENVIDRQLDLSFNILKSDEVNAKKQLAFIDSLKNFQAGDKVYKICLQIQTLLEKNLQKTLVFNSELANKLSFYNRILALMALLAIVSMTTIIINRHARQLKLIDKLKAAQETALKSKNAKDEFLANMSHELRTPLNALIGFGNLLSKTSLDKKQLQYVDIITTSGQNLLNIVNDILDLSKIEAGKLDLKYSVFNLEDLLKNVELMFSASVSEKDLTYSWSMDERISKWLKGDPERLKQIFVNLIGNAIKFTTHGGIHLHAGIVWNDENKKQTKLIFTIKDSGTGIPSEKIQKIFDRFEQLEHATTRQHGGTGLGLTIVKNLVEKMGGAVSVFSEVGIGSEFNFTCLFEKIDEKEVSPIGLAEGENLTSLKTGLKILAAEDNKANKLLLQHIFEKYNIETVIANNGKIALDFAEKYVFDIIMLDIQMPVMDGYRSVKAIKETLKLKTPVIAMTAFASENEINKCYQFGFDDYISKPISETQLMEKIKKFVSLPIIDHTTKLSNNNNLDYLKELVGGDPVAVNGILQEVKQQWQTDKSELALSASSGDLAETKRILHRIRSTFSPLGPGHKVYEIVNNKKENLVDGSMPVYEKCITYIEAIDEIVNPILNQLKKYDE